jgi:parallel beta-helix repeat protein
MNKNKFLLFSALLLLTCITQAIKFDDHDFDNQSDNQFRRVPLLVSTDVQKASEGDNSSEELRENLKGFTGGFLENKGQKNSSSYFYTGNSLMNVGFGRSEIKFSFVTSSTDGLTTDLSEEQSTNENVAYTTISLQLLGSNRVVPLPKEPTGVFENFLIGSDKGKWVLSSQYYSQIVYYNIYEKIDLVYEIKDGQLKYEFFVYPGGNYKEIKLKWSGPVSLELVNAGMKISILHDNHMDIEYSSEIGFIDEMPICYQSLSREMPINASFELLESSIYGFIMPPFYDPSKLLIIDPVIEPIYIDGDSDFGPSGYNFAGSGTAGDPYLIEDYIITNSTTNLIYIRYTTAYFIVQNNTLDGLTGSYDGILLVNVTHGVIDNNIIYNGRNGILLYSDSHNNTVTNNTIYNNIVSGVQLFAAINNTIYGNNINGYGSTYHGIMLNVTNNYNTISSNTVYNNTFVGIYMVDSADNILTNNTIYNNSLNGIGVYGSDNNNFTDNLIHHNVWDGIELNGSNYNIFSKNTITNNEKKGISQNGGVNSTFLRNTIANNSDRGIMLFSTSNNIISNNLIYNNSQLGLFLLSANNNIITWNNFINNPSGGPGFSQAGDSGSSNVFNYNHWNHWISPDADEDGIVDNTYSINGSAGNSDPYPLVFPYSGFLTRGPIDIDNDTAFGPSGYNFPGSGIYSDPYIIEGYQIATSTTTLIHIQDTTAFFIIRNNLLDGVTGSNDGIYFRNVTHGTIDNNIIHSSDSGICLYLSSNSNTIWNNTISNNTVDGILLVVSSSNNTILSNSIANNGWNGIQLSGSSNNNTIWNNTITNNSFDGILLSSSSNNTIWNNTINNSQHGIKLLGFSNNNTIWNNTITNNSLHGIRLSGPSNNNIWNNFISDNTYDGIWLSGSSNNNIWNNTLSNNSRYGIWLSNSPNNTIWSNTIANNSWSGIHLYGSHNNTISQNYIYNNSQSGIYVFLSSNNTFHNNTIYENTFGLDLNITFSTTIRNNKIYDNGHDAIRMWNSDNNTIASNTIYNTSASGLSINTATNIKVLNNEFYENDYALHTYLFNDSLISGNIIYNHSNQGMRFWACINNTIFNNTIEDNAEDGIGLYSASNNNTIWNNTISNNTWGGIRLVSSSNNTIWSNPPAIIPFGAIPSPITPGMASI